MSGVIVLCKSISSGGQHVTLQKYFSHPSLVIYKFATTGAECWYAFSRQTVRLCGAKTIILSQTGIF
jgi:hypothetical protein